ncbi:magnesium transporter CorA family protein [Acinetobacter rudis]|uniref:Magnesium transporter CorA family protein n=1 Tax=Acinetobacter rudis TaxID=632955 RepID=A0AAW8JAZ8_9GAMM|nr:magnesium transporter CorA family protein [Acinetobacter rudis]MDQ8937257.1 magnesium transporter CorA family protein [Acinetobacter rudis]MDQ8953990.1 magnesium transporter CorA family protein [Acinetobacter rudis]MDQ9019459.1 magnesium transporter CorA family protein [Acinetobacter rudis]
MFKTNETQMQIHSSIHWLKVIDPDQDYITHISNQFSIPYNFIQTALDENASARIQCKQQSTLIMTHLPFITQSKSGQLVSCKSFAIIIKDHLVFIVSKQDHPIFDQMIHYVEQGPEQAIEQLAQQVYHFLELAADQFIIASKIVNAQITLVEQELLSSIKNKQVFKLLNHNKALNRIAISLRGNSKVLNLLNDMQVITGHSLAKHRLLNVMVETDQAQAMAEIHNINLSNLMDAYSAAIENNLSLLVQYLSVYVIIAAIPLGIASLYGMNIPLPFQEQPFALSLLAGLSLLLSVAIVIIFKKRQII